MLESWLASPAAKLKKRRDEMPGDVDVAGIGQLLQLCEAMFMVLTVFCSLGGNINIHCLEGFCRDKRTEGFEKIWTIIYWCDISVIWKEP